MTRNPLNWLMVLFFYFCLFNGGGNFAIGSPDKGIMSMSASERAKNPAEGPGWFVSAAWLHEHLTDPELRLIQVGGEGYYEQTHIPGARLLLMNQLVGPQGEVPAMRLPPEALGETFRGLGIDADSRVVAYDAVGGMDAARFLWTLTSMGQTGEMGILDGGMAVWMNQGLPTNDHRPPPGDGRFVPNPNREFEVDWREVMAVVAGERFDLLLDTRSWREYVGLTIGSPRGHISGAIHLDWTESLVSLREPLLKGKGELLAMLAKVGLIRSEQPVVLYCQTAHRASQTWVLLRHLGFWQVRLYDGSIAEWRVRNLTQILGETP